MARPWFWRAPAALADVVLEPPPQLIAIDSDDHALDLPRQTRAGDLPDQRQGFESVDGYHFFPTPTKPAISSLIFRMIGSIACLIGWGRPMWRRRCSPTSALRRRRLT